MTIQVHKWIMDIADSIDYDKEKMLNELVESFGLEPEIFARDYIIEEYPVVLVTASDPDTTEVNLHVSQEFKVRKKTKEEHQLEIETGEN